MMCHRIGIPPISTIGLGRRDVSSPRRVPNPPARITACTRTSFEWAQAPSYAFECVSSETSTVEVANPGRERSGGLAFDPPTQILSVIRAAERRCQGLELTRVDKAAIEGDLLRARDLEALPFLERSDELRRLDQAVGRAGIEPGIAAAHHLDGQLSAFQIGAVDVGDLKLAAGRWLEVGGDVDHLPVVEIEPGDRPVGPRRVGLFLN